MTTNQDGPNTTGAAGPVAWRVDDLTARGEVCGCFKLYTDYEKVEQHVAEGGVRFTKVTPLYAQPPENPSQRPSDEVRERVARALHKNRCPKSNWDKALPGTHDLFFRQADAALSAIPADPVTGMEVVLPPAADVSEEYMNGWIEGQQYLIAAYRGK